MAKSTEYLVTKIKGKKWLIERETHKRIARITQNWVKIGDYFTAKELKVEGKCVGFRAGWYELSLKDNEFKPDKDWKQFRVSVRCPVCKKFSHN